MSKQYSGSVNHRPRAGSGDRSGLTALFSRRAWLKSRVAARYRSVHYEERARWPLRGGLLIPVPMEIRFVFNLDVCEKRMRIARCWLAAVLSISCLIGSDEVLASPMAGEYQIDAGSELRICSNTTWCVEPASIAGVRFRFDPDDPWPLYRELFDGTYDLYDGNLVSAGVYRILDVIKLPGHGALRRKR